MTTTNKKPAARKPASKPSTKRTANPTGEEAADLERQIDEQLAYNDANAGGQDLSGLDAMLDSAGDDGEGESLTGTVKEEQERKAQQAEQEAADEAAARAGAAMAVGFAETMLGMKYPFVQIPKEQRFQIIEKATPVMRKYGGGLPDWLRPYQEEIELGLVIGTAGVGVFMQVQQHKAAEQRRALEERKRRLQEQQGSPVPAGRVDLSVNENANQEGEAKRVDAA